MATQSTRPPAHDSSASKAKYYFAYGSNLHLKQMKRRCPNSKFIGCARLANYRWQINERGYANIIEAEGHWVDGLVYEIDEKDEVRLDINEGVSKNAYAKRHLPVQLRCVKGPLYRRPVSWIVEKGGPAEVILSTKQEKRTISHGVESLKHNALVYISMNYILDSKPKDEYVNRINLGLADARTLGMEDDYINNCIRPFIPTLQKSRRRRTTPSNTPIISRGEKKQSPRRTTQAISPNNAQVEAPAPKDQGQNRIKPSSQSIPRIERKEIPSEPKRQVVALHPLHQPAQGHAAPTQPPTPIRRPMLDRQALQRTPIVNTLRQRVLHGRKATSDVGRPPPLPPRPLRRFQSIPVIIIEETRHIPRSN